MARMATGLLLMASTLLALGCASHQPRALSVSLTELGTESRVDAGSWWGALRHRQAYNIAGTGAMDSIGMLSSDPDPSPLLDLWRSWFRKDLLPDQLALRLSPGCSKVYLRDLVNSSNVTADDVISVRDGLQQVQSRVVELVAAQAGQQLLSTLGKTNEEIAKLKSADAAAEGKAPTSDGSLVVLEKRKDALVAWLSATGYPSIEDGQDISALVAAGTGRVDKLTKELREAEENFAKARAKPGIIVARWKIEDSRQLQVNATAASYDSLAQENGSGFVVLGAPRVVTLAAGDDLVIRACKIEGANCKGRDGTEAQDRRSGIDSVIPPKRLYVTTYQLLAKHSAWTDARSLRRVQSLALSLNKLIETLSEAKSPKLLEAIKGLQLTLVRTSSSAVDAENMGALSGSKLATMEFSFATDALLEESVKNVIAANDEFLVISSMRSTLDGHILRQSGAGTVLPNGNRCTSLASR